MPSHKKTLKHWSSLLVYIGATLTSVPQGQSSGSLDIICTAKYSFFCCFLHSVMITVLINLAAIMHRVVQWPCGVQEAVEKKVLEMCRADPSSFVRRAAVRFVSRWCCGGTMLAAGLATLCRAVVDDVDCDVKRTAVRFWRQYLPNVNQLITVPCCQAAVVAGSIGCLLVAVSDCDRAVRIEALATLADVRRVVKTQPDLLFSSKRYPADRLHSHDGSCCDQICSHPDFLNASLKPTPQISACEVFSDEDRSTAAMNCPGANGDQLPCLTNDNMTCSESTLTRLRAALLNTDWDSLFVSESQQSDDCHANNPTSLLDDILKTARRENDVSDENNGDGDNIQDPIIIDCY